MPDTPYQITALHPFEPDADGPGSVAVVSVGVLIIWPIADGAPGLGLILLAVLLIAPVVVRGW